MDRVILLLSCVAETYMLYDFFCGFFNLRASFQTLWKRALLILSLAVCLFCVNLLGNTYVNLVCTCLVIVGCCILFFQGCVGMRALCCIVALLIGVGCEFLFSVLLNIRYYSQPI